MNDPDLIMPTGGGCYIREADGSLRQVGEPTRPAPVAGAEAPGATVEAPLQDPVETAVEIRADDAPAFKSRRAQMKET